MQFTTYLRDAVRSGEVTCSVRICRGKYYKRYRSDVEQLAG